MNRRVTSMEETLAVALLERDANRCVLVWGCEPVFVLLCDAEELLHLRRSWRCGRPARIEWPCELAEEAVEFLLGHDDRGYRARRSISEGVLDISRDRNDLAGSHCLPALGLEYLKRTIQHIKYLWIGVAMEWNHDS